MNSHELAALTKGLPVYLRERVKTPSKGDGYKITRLNAGGSLYLKVREGRRGASISWIAVFNYQGKAKRPSVGTLRAVPTVKEARRLAEELVESWITNGGNPKEEGSTPAEEAKAPAATVRELCPQWLEAVRIRKNGQGETIERIRGRFAKHVLPAIGDKSPAEITPEDIAAMLNAVPGKKATRDKAHNQVNDFFNWAISKGLVTESPTRQALLKPFLQQRVNDKENYPFLDYRDIPRFIAALTAPGSIEYIGSLALLFAILNCGRAAMIRGIPAHNIPGLHWGQIQTEESGRVVLRIDAAAMKVKGNGDLVCPLSRQSLALLDHMRTIALTNPENSYALVFPSAHGNALSDATMSKRIHALDAADRAQGGPGFRDPDKTEKDEAGNEIKDADGRPVHPVATQHAISRASFETWARETHPELNADIIGLCLHHRPDDKYGGAYNRSKYEELRANLMQEWADYCFSLCPDRFQLPKSKRIYGRAPGRLALAKES